jgi:hypothetical protein
MRVYRVRARNFGLSLAEYLYYLDYLKERDPIRDPFWRDCSRSGPPLAPRLFWDSKRASQLATGLGSV